MRVGCIVLGMVASCGRNSFDFTDDASGDADIAAVGAAVSVVANRTSAAFRMI